jgi:hypothetical protein
MMIEEAAIWLTLCKIEDIVKGIHKIINEQGLRQNSSERDEKGDSMRAIIPFYFFI